MLRRARHTALFALKPPPKPSCHRRSPRRRPVVCSTLARMYLRKVMTVRLPKTDLHITIRAALPRCCRWLPLGCVAPDCVTQPQLTTPAPASAPCMLSYHKQTSSCNCKQRANSTYIGVLPRLRSAPSAGERRAGQIRAAQPVRTARARMSDSEAGASMRRTRCWRRRCCRSGTACPSTAAPAWASGAASPPARRSHRARPCAAGSAQMRD